MYTRQVVESNDISSLLMGFAFAGAVDSKDGNAITITFANENHVAVDLILSDEGNHVTYPYVIDNDLHEITDFDSK